MNEESEKRIRNIIEALHAAECTGEVYEALLHVPVANLRMLRKMLDDILSPELIA